MKGDTPAQLGDETDHLKITDAGEIQHLVLDRRIVFWLLTQCGINVSTRSRSQYSYPQQTRNSNKS